MTRRSETTHIVVDAWAETIVVNEPERPSMPHSGDKCALADTDCQVTFRDDEVVFMPIGSRNGHANRYEWVCGLHIFTAEGNYGGERRFV